MRVFKVLFFKLVPVFLLTGCWDRAELEEQAYVVVLGLDKSRNNLVDVTFQIANPQVGSSDKGMAQNEPSSDTLTFTAPDIIAAKDLANSVITRKISFAHLRTIIVGEELAKSPLFHPIISASIRDPEMRRETNLMVSREKARDFIDANKPKLETRPHKYYAFMQERWRDTGHVPYATLNRYFQRLGGELYLAIYATTKRDEKYKENEDSYVAGQVPQKSGDPVQIMGSAVFKAGIMIGTLTGEETRYALALRRKALARTYLASYPDPLNRKHRISLRLVKDTNTKVNINVKTDPPQVKVTIPLKAQIYSIPSLINYASDLQKQKLLQQAIKEDLEVGTMRLIKKAQKQFKAEPFTWNVEARRKFWTWQEYEKYDWETKFRNAKVQVEYNLEIESFGKEIQPSRISNQAKE